MTAESAAPALNLADLGLTPDLLRRAAAVGWRSATAVQAAAIPAILQGRDLLAVAPTGSGKTATFVLPLLQRLLAQPDLRIEKPRRLRALILTPTRELALQIGAVLGALAPPLKTMVTVGGGSINPQLMALRGGAHLVVATPGRLLDLIGHKALSLAALQLLVLDEADRLLDLGFADEVGAVLAGLPKVRQTLMLSATMPDDVAALAGRALHDPLHVDVGSGSTAALPDIRQRAIQVDKARRTALLRHLIRSEHWPRVLVFVATQHATEHVADKLRQSGVPAAALHGALSQGRRNQALADLHSGALTVLVATDLAARGIDVTQLPVVVNHDLPRSVVDYTHRIGRTGRAGQAGLAVSFIMADAAGSEAQFRLIEKRRQQRVPREQVAGFEPAAPLDGSVAAASAGGVKGHRKSRKDKLREAAALRP
ncbi:MAG: DEAD/DEAH box helicase [Rubrivivax sp.]|nr:DEAD/DEAH box helicase [Rubrivivax sp.]